MLHQYGNIRQVHKGKPSLVLWRHEALKYLSIASVIRGILGRCKPPLQVVTGVLIYLYLALVLHGIDFCTDIHGTLLPVQPSTATVL